MFRKNTASQFVHFQLVLAATGAAATGLSPAVRRCLDGTFGAGGGTVTEDTGTGGYKYAMAQADTNANNVGLFFTGTGAVPVCINFVTTAADPTDAARLGLTSLPNDATAPINFVSAIDAVPQGTVTSGSSTTSVTTSALSIAGSAASGVVANQFAGRTILFRGDTTTAGLRGAASAISANTASNTPTLTVGTLPATPASGDLFSII